MTAQELRIQLIETALKYANEVEGGKLGKDYQNLLHLIIDGYSNAYYDEATNRQIIMWWPMMKTISKEAIRKTLLVSKDAAGLLDKYYKTDTLKKILHLEHITPMAYTRHKLTKLIDITPKTIKDCFKYSKVILITKEESMLLDGKGIRITNKDIDLFTKMKPTVEELAEAKTWVGKSPKSEGTGLFRVSYLLDRGVEFVDESNNILLLDKIIEKIKEENFRIKNDRK